MAALALRDEPE